MVVPRWPVIKRLNCIWNSATEPDWGTSGCLVLVQFFNTVCRIGIWILFRFVACNLTVC